ncbi:hypothetical protein IEZ26_08730 [Nocardioides cavernae]|uniref:MarR family transcriptional regulator n=1 Tax=Nocardioides cavernae TaxID=1921566 RepID=A0ABR8N987_9ACTN|nr:hypothetical protein [Nocardioides cavernae]MBD3924702.1 hypothetical protein [Nocardioides cavernae]MBM7514924.1 hypothetical protein [Nocardioides cavernae]
MHISAIPKMIRRGDLGKRSRRPVLNRDEVLALRSAREASAAAAQAAARRDRPPKAPSPPDDRHEWLLADEHSTAIDIADASPNVQRDSIASSIDADEAVAKAQSVHPLLGSHQELVIRALAVSHPAGLSAPQINPNASTQPNTYITCDKLEALGLIRCDTNTHPKRYYLGPRMLR